MLKFHWKAVINVVLQSKTQNIPQHSEEGHEYLYNICFVREGNCLGVYDSVDGRQYHIAREPSMAIFDFVLWCTCCIASCS